MPTFTTVDLANGNPTRMGGDYHEQVISVLGDGAAGNLPHRLGRITEAFCENDATVAVTLTASTNTASVTVPNAVTRLITLRGTM